MRVSRRVNQEIDEMIHNLEQVRVALLTAVQREAQTLRSKITTREQLVANANSSRKAAQCVAQLRRLMNSGTLSELVKRKTESMEMCARLKKALQAQALTVSQADCSIKKRFEEALEALNESGRVLRESTAKLAATDGESSKGDSPNAADGAENESSSLPCDTLARECAENAPSTSEAETDVILCVGGKCLLGRRMRMPSMYDTTRDSWTDVYPYMFYSRAYAAAATWNGKVFVSGGIGGDDEGVLDSVERYDPEANLWTQFRSLRVRRREHVLVNADNTLFAIGGWARKAPFRSVERFNVEIGDWRQAPTL